MQLAHRQYLHYRQCGAIEGDLSRGAVSPEDPLSTFIGVARVMLQASSSRVPWTDATRGWSALGGSRSAFFFIHCWLRNIRFFTPQLPHDVNRSTEDGGNWTIHFKSTFLIQIKTLTKTYQVC